MAVLGSYAWPGNIRELENTIERIVILSQGDEIGVEDLPAEVRAGAPTSAPRSHLFQLPEQGVDLEEVELDLLQQALENSAGNTTKAAKLVGLTPKTFEARMQRLGLQ